MAKRWLRAELSRELVGQVYVCIDDEKIPIEYFGTEENPRSRILLTGDIRRAVLRAVESHLILDETDLSVGHVNEVPQEVAEKAGCFDAILMVPERLKDPKPGE